MPRRRRPLTASVAWDDPGLGRTSRLMHGLRGITVLSLLALPLAITGANAVETSNAGLRSSAIDVNDLKPADCGALNLSTLSTGTDTVAGGTTNDLVLGGPAAQTLDGGSGDDCILGGGGDDQINGGAGTDVCIGGPGIDTFGADCETTVQDEATF